MKRFATVIFCSIVLLLVYISTSSATPIIGGVFDGWDADPISAVSISNDVAILQNPQNPADITSSTIYLTHDFTGVSAISFNINFINAGVETEIPSYLQVSFVTASDQLDFIGYDRSGVYDPADPIINIEHYGQTFFMNLPDLGGIDGTLYFILQYEGNDNSSQGLVSNVIVTENQTNPVPEPSTMLLFGIGFVAVQLFRSRKMQANG